MIEIIRPVIPQVFFNFRLTVGVVPTPLGEPFQQAAIESRIDAFIISVPTAAANPVYLGGPNVDAVTPNGLEIRQGVPIQLSIRNERQLYELQAPLVKIGCTDADTIPLVVWDLSSVYLVATAPTGVGVVLFKAHQ